MTDTTTIEITKNQKAQLDELKEHEKEPYKSVIGRHISAESPTDNTDTQTIIKKLDQIQGAQGDTVSQALEIGEHGVYEMTEELEQLKDELQGSQTVELEATAVNDIADEVERRLGR